MSQKRRRTKLVAGLEANFIEPETGEVITTAARYNEQRFFSKGFGSAKIDRCKLSKYITEELHRLKIYQSD